MRFPLLKPSVQGRLTPVRFPWSDRPFGQRIASAAPWRMMSADHRPEDAPNVGTNRSRWRFLLTPWWIVGHIVVVVAVVSFINLGLWQLDRHEERREYNAAFTAQMEQEPVGLQEIEPLLAEGESAAAFRRVEISGEFDEAQEVLLSTRSMDGTPGHHLLTPFETDAHGTVLVDRGWIPLDMGAEPPPVETAEPPEGETLVNGVLFPSTEARNAGSQDGQTDELEFMSDVDVQRFALEQDGPVGRK